MTSQEDEITTKIIRREKDRSERRGEDVEIVPEAHYNHYGSRGVVDLYVQRGGVGILYEVKSEYAVKNATGANEIVRQFNKMQEHFYQGSSYSVPEHRHYRLVFPATEYIGEHLDNNASIYESVITSFPNPYPFGTDAAAIDVFPPNDSLEKSRVFSSQSGRNDCRPVDEDGWRPFTKAFNRNGE